MTDSIIPDWIKKIKAEEDRKIVREHTAALEAALIEKTIQADGPAYWKQLLKELHVAVEGLKLLGIAGSISTIQERDEEGVQVKLLLSSHPDRQDFVNLFYNSGEMGLR